MSKCANEQIRSNNTITNKFKFTKTVYKDKLINELIKNDFSMCVYL